jgi:hypothetical protein
MFTIPFYCAINLMDTAPLDSFDTLTGLSFSYSVSLAHSFQDPAAKEVGISDLLKEEGDIVPIADIQITVVNDLLFGNRSHPKKSKVRNMNDDAIPFIS